jgi:hypothetical protein
VNYPNPKDNPARQALTRAVNKALTNGAPVYVNQPAPVSPAVAAADLARVYEYELTGFRKLERIIDYLQADAFQCARSWAHGNDSAGPELLGSHEALKLAGRIRQDWIESL